MTLATRSRAISPERRHDADGWSHRSEGAPILCALCEVICSATSARYAAVAATGADGRPRIVAEGGDGVPRHPEDLALLEAAAERTLLIRSQDLSGSDGTLSVAISDVARSINTLELSREKRVLGVLLIDASLGSLSAPDSQLILRQAKAISELLQHDSDGRREASRIRARRLALVSEIHDGVIQDLFAVSLRLSSLDMPTATDCHRSADEIQGALADLRAVLRRYVSAHRAARPAPRTLAGVRAALRDAARDVCLDIDLADALEPPADLCACISVFANEGVCNALKHANPSTVSVRGTVDDGMLRVSILNDGLGPAPASPGIGLTLLALEAALLGGAVSYGRAGETWRLMLTVPWRGA